MELTVHAHFEDEIFYAALRQAITMENAPGFRFDALMLPDGAGAVEALDAHANTLEFVRAQYWHCKTILAFGASQALLSEAQVPMTLPDGAADPGLILADAADADAAIIDFIAAIGGPGHFGREEDGRPSPPRDRAVHAS